MQTTLTMVSWLIKACMLVTRGPVKGVDSLVEHILNRYNKMTNAE
jgi:hypothetical protein